MRTLLIIVPVLVEPPPFNDTEEADKIMVQVSRADVLCCDLQKNIDLLYNDLNSRIAEGTMTVATMHEKMHEIMGMKEQIAYLTGKYELRGESTYKDAEQLDNIINGKSQFFTFAASLLRKVATGDMTEDDAIDDLSHKMG